jgi:hypothetical protein
VVHEQSCSALLKQYPVSPPGYLSASIHSLLLSTLLQPSAVLLALWYIVRLPVYFDAAVLSADHVKEIHFRAELFGHATENPDRDAKESSAPFKLILLGCMLANKWLDDHTFSNKTWLVNSHPSTRHTTDCTSKQAFDFQRPCPLLEQIGISHSGHFLP